MQALEARRQIHLMAIGSYRLARIGITFTVLLGRPLDRALLEKLRAGPAAALALSDGTPRPDVDRRRRARRGGQHARGPRGEGMFAPAGADWMAAAVPVADKAWAGRASPTGPGRRRRLRRCLGLRRAWARRCCSRGGRHRPPAAAGAEPTRAGAVASLDARRGRPARGESPPFLAASTPASLTPRVAGARPPRPARAAQSRSPPRPRSLPRAASSSAATGCSSASGKAGMAEVFTAVLSGAEGFERLVVIKRLKPHLALNPDAVSQFIDEAKLGSVLTHSNIVTVSDFGKVGDGYYLAQEFVDGRTLAQIATRYREKYDRTLPAAMVFHVVHEVLAGIAYAHDRLDAQGRPLGIVHRDVSPRTSWSASRAT